MKNKKSTLKVITILGTRPEIIRLSMVMPLFDKYLNHITVHTGQNYDYELNRIFYEDLNLRKPDYYLDVNTNSLGHVLGETLIKIEEVFAKEKPDAVLILGDTNASIAAMMAKRMRIPIYHMEAGNRSFDLNVPEEINRRIIDHTADFNLVYTEHSRRHLLSEGLSHRHIYLTGSPMFEVLNFYKNRIKESDILKKLNLTEKEYIIVSSHREENVDKTEYLTNIILSLNNLAEKYNFPIIVSTHPRTQKQLNKLESLEIDKRIQFLKPFGFFDYNSLQVNALCSISDSGTISEESAILKFPAITIRSSMERPEALDTGSIILTGLDPDLIVEAVGLVVDEHSTQKQISIPDEYKIENTSWRVLKLIMGTSKLSNSWQGIK
jgi:UDP-N-acetyl-L-fucosamine synthase